MSTNSPQLFSSNHLSEPVNDSSNYATVFEVDGDKYNVTLAISRLQQARERSADKPVSRLQCRLVFDGSLDKRIPAATMYEVNDRVFVATARYTSFDVTDQANAILEQRIIATELQGPSAHEPAEIDVLPGGRSLHI